MRRMTVWDGWIRLVHWSVVVLLGVSYASIQAGWMKTHYASGYAVLALVLFRLAWGLVGSDTARFGRFLKSPVAALAHLRHLRGASRTGRSAIMPPAAGWCWCCWRCCWRSR